MTSLFHIQLYMPSEFNIERIFWSCLLNSLSSHQHFCYFWFSVLLFSKTLKESPNWDSPLYLLANSHTFPLRACFTCWQPQSHTKFFPESSDGYGWKNQPWSWKNPVCLTGEETEGKVATSQSLSRLLLASVLLWQPLCTPMGKGWGREGTTAHWLLSDNKSKLKLYYEATKSHRCWGPGPESHRQWSRGPWIQASQHKTPNSVPFHFII